MGEQAPLHQLYCTHCTYGSSALEQRKGPGADRVLGYSARASSLSRNELPRFYRAVERYMYYYLPSDTPSEKKEAYPLDEAPIRLIFHPSVAGFQLAAQVCYRAFDSVGRPGSYFAHALISQRQAAESPWSIIDALQLWGSPEWVSEDDLEKGYELSSLDSLSDMSPASPMPIDNRVFEQFLLQKPGGTFSSKLIPQRWREMPPENRRRFFVKALASYLEIARKGSRESLLLVMEPEISVVFFYGIAILLPLPLRNKLSFSTFEASPERLCTTLAALSFDDPQNSDLKAEQYHRSYVVNTFLDKSSPARHEGGTFDKIVARLETEPKAAWREIHDMLKYEDGVCETIKQLDELAEATTFVPVLFDPDSSAAKDSAPPNLSRRTALQDGYLRESVREWMSEPLDRAKLKKLQQSPERLLTVLEMLAPKKGAQEHGPELRKNLNCLALDLPPETITEVLASKWAPPDFKFQALHSYVINNEELPGGCERLWDDVIRASGGTRDEPLMTHLFRELPAGKVAPLSEQVPARAQVPFFFCLLDSSAQLETDDDKWTERQTILRSLIASFDDKQFTSLLNHNNSRMDTHLASLSDPISRRLKKIVNSLIDLPAKELLASIEFLIPQQELMSEKSRKRVKAWGEIRRLLSTERTTTTTKTFFGQRSRHQRRSYPETLGERLAISLHDALPSVVFVESTIKDKVRVIRALAAELGVDEERLPDRFEWKMKVFYDNALWPQLPPVQRGQRKTDYSYVVVIAVVLSAFGLIVFGIAWTLLKPNSSESAMAPTDTPQPITTQVDDPDSEDDASEPEGDVKSDRDVGLPQGDPPSPTSEGPGTSPENTPRNNTPLNPQAAETKSVNVAKPISYLRDGFKDDDWTTTTEHVTLKEISSKRSENYRINAIHGLDAYRSVIDKRSAFVRFLPLELSKDGSRHYTVSAEFKDASADTTQAEKVCTFWLEDEDSEDEDSKALFLMAKPESGPDRQEVSQSVRWLRNCVLEIVDENAEPHDNQKLYALRKTHSTAVRPIKPLGTWELDLPPYVCELPEYVDTLCLGEGQIVLADGTQYTFGKLASEKEPCKSWPLQDLEERFVDIERADINLTVEGDKLQLQLRTVLKEKDEKTATTLREKRDRIEEIRKKLDRNIVPLKTKSGEFDNEPLDMDSKVKAAEALAPLVSVDMNKAPPLGNSGDSVASKTGKAKEYLKWIEESIFDRAKAEIASNREEYQRINGELTALKTKRDAPKKDVASEGALQVNIYRVVESGDGEGQKIKIRVPVIQAP